MRQLVLIPALLVAVLAVAPASADEPLPEIAPDAAPEISPEAAPDAEGDAEQGFSLIEEGARLLLRGLMAEMEPAMKDMAEGLGAFAREAEPMMRELSGLMGSIGDYHAPELLPNGDIIIRKRVPGAPPGPQGPQFGPGGETDL